MTAQPPVWTAAQLDADRATSIGVFRQERMAEPLEQYLAAFDDYRASVQELLETTVDLSLLSEQAIEVLTDPALLEAARYLAGPPISLDDLRTLAEASVAPKVLRNNPEVAQRVIDTVLLGLDRRRFPWVGEDREPTEAEREAAALASAALMASQRMRTSRANEGKTAQEQAVSDRLEAAHLNRVPARTISTLADAPAPGEFCGESLVGSRKADIVVRLFDNRLLPIECKVSNSSTNSIKRLNNDAAVKATRWREEFGTTQIVPSAVLSGVFKLNSLVQAQNSHLTLFWAHNLDPLVDFIEATR